MSYENGANYSIVSIFLDMDVYEVLIYLTPAVNPVDLNLGDFSYAAWR